MANEFWLFSYAIGVLGSASFGYLVLRYGFPDFRTLPDESKLGISGILGIGLFALAYFASLFFQPITIWMFLAGLTLLSVLVLGLKNNTLTPSEVKVAVPIVRLAELPQPMGVPEFIGEPKVLDRRVFTAKRVRTKEEKPEIVPEQTEKEEKELRARGKRKEEIQETLESAKQPVTAAAPRPQSSRPRGRERYQRRKDMISQVKTDLTKPKAAVEYTSPELEEKAEESLELGEGLDLSDLENVESLEDLSELTDVSLEELGDMNLESLAGVSETQKIPKAEAQGAKCPNCGKLKGTIVYCPYCGKGFCSDCSTAVKREGELIHYKCPTCAKEVIVKDTAEKKEEKKKPETKEKPITISADRPGGTDSYVKGKYKPGS